jgi:hypothetical protein
MELFRAMSEVEFQETLHSQQPPFLRRFKWFSPNHQFVQDRVQDGKFNNSRFKPERYTRLVRFVISPESVRFFRKSPREWMLDRRMAHLVSWLSIVELPSDSSPAGD